MRRFHGSLINDTKTTKTNGIGAVTVVVVPGALSGSITRARSLRCDGSEHGRHPWCCSGTTAAGGGGGGGGGGSVEGGGGGERRRRRRCRGMPIRGECHRIRCHRSELSGRGKQPMVGWRRRRRRRWRRKGAGGGRGGRGEGREVDRG